MDRLMFAALKSADIKEEAARAIALEASQNDLRFLAMEHAFDKLYSQMDKTAAELRKDMADLRTDIIENQNRNTNRLLENKNRNANRQLESHNRQLENANRNSRFELMIMLGGIAVGVTVTIGCITTLLVFLV